MIYKEVQTDFVRWNDATIDYAKGTIQNDDQVCELTKNELFILLILLQRMDQIVSRDELMRELWDDERFVNDNRLSVNINRLRIKLEGIGLIDVIITKKGLGYMAITSKR